MSSQDSSRYSEASVTTEGRTQAGLVSLLERLELGDEGSRFLDAALAVAFNWAPKGMVRLCGRKDAWMPAFMTAGGVVYEAPQYTHDTHDAIRLVAEVLPGRNFDIEVRPGQDLTTDAIIYGADGYFEEPKTETVRGYAQNPARALCIALLKACIEGERAKAQPLPLTEGEG